MKTNMSLENSRWKKTFLWNINFLVGFRSVSCFFVSQRFFPTLENLSSGHCEKNRCLLKTDEGISPKNIKSCRRECRFPKRSIFFGEVWDHPNVVFAYTHDGWMFFHYEISMMSWKMANINRGDDIERWLSLEGVLWAFGWVFGTQMWWRDEKIRRKRKFIWWDMFLLKGDCKASLWEEALWDVDFPWVLEGSPKKKWKDWKQQKRTPEWIQHLFLNSFQRHTKCHKTLLLQSIFGIC